MKKVFIYLLVGFLSFSVVFSNYYKSVHAMDWVSGALSFAESLTWVLASLGITCTISDYTTEVDKSRDEFWSEYEQDFYDYVDSHDGNTASDRFSEWIDNLCKGTLDKSSEYWGMFKSWASSLVSGSSSGGSNGTVINGFSSGGSFSFQDILLATGYTLADYNATNFSDLNTTISPAVVYYATNSTYKNLSIIVTDDGSAPVFDLNGDYLRATFSSGRTLYTFATNSIPSSVHYNVGAVNLINISNTSSIGKIYGYDGSIQISGLSNFNIGGAVSNSDFDSVASNVNDLDIISSDGVDEDNPEVTLPYPGISDSDDSISSDAYQDIIDAINDGTITQEEGVERIQEILKVITYDTVTDKVIPPQKDPDSGEDKTKDDVLKENKENMGFTLAGLETVFPFCIPFDIYAFMTLLVADPLAPEVDFPIKSVNGEVEEIHIDLSPFDSVAVVVRYIFDFLFIIGLGILTRSLIGGGSSD